MLNVWNIGKYLYVWVLKINFSSGSTFYYTCILKFYNSHSPEEIVSGNYVVTINHTQSIDKAV